MVCGLYAFVIWEPMQMESLWLSVDRVGRAKHVQAYEWRLHNKKLRGLGTDPAV